MDSIFSYGGVQRVTAVIAKELAKDCNVTIVTYDNPKTENTSLYDLNKANIHYRFFCYPETPRWKELFCKAYSGLFRMVFPQTRLTSDWYSHSSFPSEKRDALVKELKDEAYNVIIGVHAPLAVRLAACKSQLGGTKLIGWIHNSYEALFGAGSLYIGPELRKHYEYQLQKLDKTIVLCQDDAHKYHFPVEVIYNPLTLEPKEKVMHLVSACRLDDKVKGGERTLKLIEALDRYCNKTGRHYVWSIFTNPKLKITINSPNVAIMKPRVDVRPYIAEADYVLQLSNDMETYCYTMNEALGYGVPVVTTPLSVVKELPIDDNMRIELNWDCSNVDDVARQIFEKEVKPFNYEIPKDNWSEILEKGESTYKEERDMVFKVRAIINFNDLEENEQRKIGDEFECSKTRYEYLLEHNAVELIEEPKKEETKEAEEIEETIEEEAETKATIKKKKNKK